MLYPLDPAVEKQYQNPDDHSYVLCIPYALKTAEQIIPIPNQSAIFVGSSSAPQRTCLYASVAEILAALISSLI